MPPLRRPFWRFNIDTAEPDGQFELLLKAEEDGAEVYYAAPRFTDWSHYVEIFKDASVVDSSLLVRPSDIRRQLILTGQPDGLHRIVYDPDGVYVCSSPAEIPEFRVGALVDAVATKARRETSLSSVIRTLYDGLSRRSEIRREVQADGVKWRTEPSYERGEQSYLPGRLREIVAGERPSEPYLERRRHLAMTQFRDRGGTEDAAMAAVAATEAWAAGAQLLLVTPQE